MGGPLDMIYHGRKRKEGEEGRGKIGRMDVYWRSNTPRAVGSANLIAYAHSAWPFYTDVVLLWLLLLLMVVPGDDPKVPAGLWGARGSPVDSPRVPRVRTQPVQASTLPRTATPVKQTVQAHARNWYMKVHFLTNR